MPLRISVALCACLYVCPDPSPVPFPVPAPSASACADPCACRCALARSVPTSPGAPCVAAQGQYINSRVSRQQGGFFGVTPLQCALHHNHPHIVKYLLSNNAHSGVDTQKSKGGHEASLARNIKAHAHPVLARSPCEAWRQRPQP